MKSLGLAAAALCGCVLLPVSLTRPAHGGEYRGDVPTRYGAGVVAGASYNPRGVSFLMINGFALYDYDRVWRHLAPEPLRFKVEGNAGIAFFESEVKLTVAADMLALLYLGIPGKPRVRPYGEAGIGIIYTDFRVEGQGLRVNFNPQAGVGMEFDTAAAGTWYAAVRLHHVSNANLADENRGINSLVVTLGRFF